MAGMFRPLKIIAPKGTVANVVILGASSMHEVTGFRMVDAVFGVLAGLLPDQVLAAGEGGRPPWPPCARGHNRIAALQSGN